MHSDFGEWHDSRVALFTANGYTHSRLSCDIVAVVGHNIFETQKKKKNMYTCRCSYVGAVLPRLPRVLLSSSIPRWTDYFFTLHRQKSNLNYAFTAPVLPSSRAPYILA